MPQAAGKNCLAGYYYLYITVGGHIFWWIRKKLTLLLALLDIFAQIENK